MATISKGRYGFQKNKSINHNVMSKDFSYSMVHADASKKSIKVKIRNDK